MRVRGLIGTLKKQNLLHTENLSKHCQDEFVYVDVSWFFKGIDGLVDPSMHIMESYSSCVSLKVNQILGKLDYYGINAIFVFPGLPYRHNMNIKSGLNLFRMSVYKHMTNPEAEFNNNFDLDSTILFLLSKYLKASKRYLVYAPYLPAAQITLFNKKGLCNVAISSPSILLFGMKSVITDVDLDSGTCSVAYLPEILESFNITLDQFIKAAVIAGSEYSYTLQRLNKEGFTFLDAVELVKSNSFEHLVRDSADQFDIVNKIIVNSLVFDRGLKSLPFNSNLDSEVYAKLAGYRIPDVLYNLLYSGFISPNLLYTLSTGEWLELPDPHVKSEEYRELLEDLRDLNLRSIEIVASKLPNLFKTREYKFKNIVDNKWNKCTLSRSLTNSVRGRFINVTAKDVANEMLRQNTDRVTIRFCLNWHFNSINSKYPLRFDQETIEKNVHDENSITCLVLFMFLDSLGYFTLEGGSTVYGLALSKVPENHVKSALIALEMLKYGIFTSEPLGGVEPVSEAASLKLLCRLASLYPIQLKGKWGVKPHLELSAFNSLVKLITNSLCVLFDACSSVVSLETNISLSKIIYIKEDIYSTVSLMGVVFKFFLEYKSSKGGKKGTNTSPKKTPLDPLELEQSLNEYFPALLYPIDAITNTAKMVVSLHGMLVEMSSKADLGGLLNEFTIAKKYLATQLQRIAVDIENERR